MAREHLVTFRSVARRACFNQITGQRCRSFRSTWGTRVSSTIRICASHQDAPKQAIVAYRQTRDRSCGGVSARAGGDPGGSGFRGRTDEKCSSSLTRHHSLEHCPNRPGLCRRVSSRRCGDRIGCHRHHTVLIMPWWSKDRRLPVSDPNRRRQIAFAAVAVVAVAAVGLLGWAIISSLTH